MANDLNHCTFIGRLGADPEIRYLPSGEPVANLRIAVGENWKDKQTGQKQERTEWVSCVMFGKLAEMVGNYWQKGTQVFVAGKMRTRKWQDQSGNDRYSTEIVVNQVQTLKDGIQNGQQPQAAPQQQRQSAPQRQQQYQQPAPVDDFDPDSIPF
jgi:single-strand DNA-binding protein